MNFNSTELLLGRQRSRQWTPLLTQQLRLRHVTQIIAFNITSKKLDSFYFTLHLTTMCAPFYTSEKNKGPNLKWVELDNKIISNKSASTVVLRVWQCKMNEMDKMVLTWGINFSGLVYIGNRITDILPSYFKENSVIFNLHGGFFTSRFTIRTDLKKSLPFEDSLNIIGSPETGIIYRCKTVNTLNSEVYRSYNLDKLRKLQSLQISLKNRSEDVKIIIDKINYKNGDCDNVNNSTNSTTSSPSSKIRYEPQLLTMNSLNRMLYEKPTTVQKQEMSRVKKEIEKARFKSKVLSNERDKKSVRIRQLRQRYNACVEENDTRNCELMENYHTLSRDAEKLKEIKRNLCHHSEIQQHVNAHVQHRRRQLMRQLLFIYPILKRSDSKYLIHNIYLPNSDILADCSDVGLAVALGYVTHILIMCSTFLQVPLRYPMTHYGSRSCITDNASPLLPDKDREFPLFARGKDKMQFTYAVYLLNKNIAQLRWLYQLHTPELKATLPNLFGMLQGPRDRAAEAATPLPPIQSSAKLASFRGAGHAHFSANITDPVIQECIRTESRIKRATSPTRKPATSPSTARRAGGDRGRRCTNSRCTKELAIPEAYLNHQISRDSFKTMAIEGYGNMACCGSSPATSTATSTNGSAVNLSKIAGFTEQPETYTYEDHLNNDSIEEGCDPLDPSNNLSMASKSVDIGGQNADKSKENHRLSRSVGSYTEETSLQLRTSLEMGSEPSLNLSCNSEADKSTDSDQKKFLEKWLETGPNLVCSEESLYPEEILGTTSSIQAPKPLTARTDALLNTKSFNLVRPK
ncbi:unnamed protein product [Brassicogethes aeneus]|uniref:UV radiation resistance-associated gene protein n=1 Tax=Brassicogethes aeneus TaxID=1431903 RepID=A0A9P0AVC9_BRAAE|nr:unnamed protein product [Brassicogethes aeneus]